MTNSKELILDLNNPEHIRILKKTYPPKKRKI